MDWTASGIQNTFAYELVPVSDLDGHVGWLDGVIGAKFTESYNSDYRYSLKLDIDGADIPLDCLVRVHHYAHLGNETYHEVLGTFMQNKRSMGYEYGREKGSVDLYSPMLALGTNRRKGNKGIPAGTVLATWFEQVVRDGYQFPEVDSNISSTKTSKKARTWESGTTYLSECHTIAKALGGRVEPDEMGHICLVKYINPAARSLSGSMPAGNDSITLVGVSIATPNIINRVVMTYERDKKRYYAAAAVGSSHPWYRRSIGRVSAENYSSQDIPETGIQAAMDQMVKERLAEVSNTQRTFSVSMLYLPWQSGNVYEFIYKDNLQEPGIHALALLKAREVTLDGTMQMQCTFQSIEEYDDGDIE